MSTSRTTYGDASRGNAAVARNESRALLGHVMGYVAVTVGFAALGAYIGRDLSGGAGLVLFFGTLSVRRIEYVRHDPLACAVQAFTVAAEGSAELDTGLDAQFNDLAKRARENRERAEVLRRLAEQATRQAENDERLLNELAAALGPASCGSSISTGASADIDSKRSR